MIRVFCLLSLHVPTKFKWETSFYDLRRFSCIDPRPFCFIGAKAERIPSLLFTPLTFKYFQTTPLNFHSSRCVFPFKRYTVNTWTFGFYCFAHTSAQFVCAQYGFCGKIIQTPVTSIKYSRWFFSFKPSYNA